MLSSEAPSAWPDSDVRHGKMSILVYVAIGILVAMGALWDLGFDSVVARVGRSVLRLVSCGRIKAEDTGDPGADIVVGGFVIIVMFLLVVLLSSLI